MRAKDRFICPQGYEPGISGGFAKPGSNIALRYENTRNEIKSFGGLKQKQRSRASGWGSLFWREEERGKGEEKKK